MPHPSKEIQDEALAFRIWRTAKSVDWACSRRAVALELGVPAHDVSRVVQAKGWGKRFSYRNPGSREGGYVGTDTYMTSNNKHGAVFGVTC